jgi:hypothetical protein
LAVAKLQRSSTRARAARSKAPKWNEITMKETESEPEQRFHAGEEDQRSDGTPFASPMIKKEPEPCDEDLTIIKASSIGTSLTDRLLCANGFMEGQKIHAAPFVRTSSPGAPSSDAGSDAMPLATASGFGLQGLLNPGTTHYSQNATGRCEMYMPPFMEADDPLFGLEFFGEEQAQHQQHQQGGGGAGGDPMLRSVQDVGDEPSDSLVRSIAYDEAVLSAHPDHQYDSSAQGTTSRQGMVAAGHAGGAAMAQTRNPSVVSPLGDLDIDIPPGIFEDLALMEQEEIFNGVEATAATQLPSAFAVASMPAGVPATQQQIQQQLHPSMPAGMHHAASLVSYGNARPALTTYASSDLLVRLSMKVFNCTPEVLVPAVRQELERLMNVGASLFEGYIRPGCVHFTVDARVSAAEARSARSKGVANAVRAALASGALPAGVTDDMLVQCHDEMVVVQNRRVIAVVGTEQSADIVPRIAAVRPIAVAPPAATAGGAVRVLLVGAGFSQPGATFMARQGGRNLAVEIADEPPAVGSFDAVTLGVLGLRPGCAELEVQSGSFLSQPRPLLVLPCEAAATEMRSLEAGDGLAGRAIASRDSFLRDMGFVLQYLDRQTAEEEGRAVPTYTSKLLRQIASTACNLAATAAAQGWTATLRLLLQAVTAGGETRATAAAAMDTHCPAGATLLHVAVGTGNAAVVRELATWAAATSASSSSSSGQISPAWCVDAQGPGGITPLHVAALLPPEVRRVVRAQLAASYPVADKLWSLACSDDGLTPETMAEMLAAPPLPNPPGDASWKAELSNSKVTVKKNGPGASHGVGDGDDGSESLTALGLAGCSNAMREGKLSSDGGLGASGWPAVPPGGTSSSGEMTVCKARITAKQQLRHTHIDNLMCDMSYLLRNRGGNTDGLAPTFIAAVALGAGLLAMVMRAMC